MLITRSGITDAVYANAQLRLLLDVETAIGISGPRIDRLHFVREHDQEIASRHHKGLRYPPSLLAHAVSLGLRGVEPRAAAKAATIETRRPEDLSSDVAEAIGRDFLARLRARPNLRKGVRSGLQQLVSYGHPVIVVTEGSKSKSKELLRHFGLENLVTRVIESPKHPDLYRRVWKLGGRGQLAVMIGDQLDRDISPAKDAGLITIFFPGGFRPKMAPFRGRCRA